MHLNKILFILLLTAVVGRGGKIAQDQDLVTKFELNQLAKSLQERIDHQALLIAQLQGQLSIETIDQDPTKTYNNPVTSATTSSPLDPSLEDRLEKLESLARIGTLRSCEEYSKYGIKTSGVYNIDPDGLLIGKPPIQVICTFDEEVVFTEIMHDTESTIEVEYCHDPGCFTRNVTYQNGNPAESVPLSQIEALIDISSTCEQSFEYDCVMAPLRDEDVDLAFWTGRDGSRKHDSEFVKITKNIYDTCFISNFSREID